MCHDAESPYTVTSKPGPDEVQASPATRTVRLHLKVVPVKQTHHPVGDASAPRKGMRRYFNGPEKEFLPAVSPKMRS